jgi:hypothetical protein
MYNKHKKLPIRLFTWPLERPTRHKSCMGKCYVHIFLIHCQIQIKYCVVMMVLSIEMKRFTFSGRFEYCMIFSYQISWLVTRQSTNLIMLREDVCMSYEDTIIFHICRDHVLSFVWVVGLLVTCSLGKLFMYYNLSSNIVVVSRLVWWSHGMKETNWMVLVHIGTYIQCMSNLYNMVCMFT